MGNPAREKGARSPKSLVRTDGWAQGCFDFPESDVRRRVPTFFAESVLSDGLVGSPDANAYVPDGQALQVDAPDRRTSGSALAAAEYAMPKRQNPLIGISGADRLQAVLGRSDSNCLPWTDAGDCEWRLLRRHDRIGQALDCYA